jgi:cobalt-zinc-cadmium efflux system outer membrane protein
MKYIYNYIVNYIFKYIVCLSFILGSGSLLAQTPLQVYQDTAALHNPGIQALYKQYEVVMQRVPQTGSLPDPTFGFGYFINSVETRVGPQRAVLSASQSFPWFGKLGAQEQATTERALAVLEKYYDQRSKLNFDVADTYNTLYVLGSAIKITQENIELLNTFKALANVRFESGKGSMVDVLRIEMELDELENQLAYLKDSKRPLVSKFEQLLNTGLTQEIEFPEVLWDEKLGLSKELIMDSVKTLNPALLSLEHELLSYEHDVVAANKTGGPSFTVGLNYTFVDELSGYSGTDNGKDVILPSIGVKIPLYRKNYNAVIKEKEISRELVALKMVDKTNALQTGLENGFRDYDGAVRRKALYIKLSDHANQAMDLLLAEYTSANTTFEEIIRMDRKLLKYKLELEKARTDQNTAVAYINYLMGK